MPVANNTSHTLSQPHNAQGKQLTIGNQKCCYGMAQRQRRFALELRSNLHNTIAPKGLGAKRHDKFRSQKSRAFQHRR